MTIYRIGIFTCFFIASICLNSNLAHAQLPGMNKDEAIVPLTTSQIKKTLQSREFEGAYPGTILGKKHYHFDRKFTSKGTVTHNEENLKTTGTWTVKDGKICYDFEDYFENQCFRVYEMGNCFYFYEDKKANKYVKGREYDRWDTRLVPKGEDGLCRVFIYKKIPGQAPILISPIY